MKIKIDKGYRATIYFDSRSDLKRLQKKLKDHFVIDSKEKILMVYFQEEFTINGITYKLKKDKIEGFITLLILNHYVDRLEYLYEKIDSKI